MAGMNQGGEEGEETIEVVAVAADTRAGGDTEIVEALDRRIIHPLAMIRATGLRNRGLYVTGVRKGGINSGTVQAILCRRRRIRKREMDEIKKSKLAT